jgi:hypothetical protein
MRIRLIRYTLLFLLVIFKCFFSSNSAIAEESLRNEEITKIAPKENSTEKILFIKNKFEKNKKYTTIEDENIFKRVLVGKWLLSPVGEIEFKNDGRFEAQGREDRIFSGFWDFRDGTLVISSNKITWKKYRVKDYELWFKDIGSLHKFGKWDKEAYSFSISFDKMIYDMSSVLQISFHTK